jgi:hypothetical protein
MTRFKTKMLGLITVTMHSFIDMYQSSPSCLPYPQRHGLPKVTLFNDKTIGDKPWTKRSILII